MAQWTQILNAAAVGDKTAKDRLLEMVYEDLRRFIYGLEKAPGFLIIDNVAIVPGRAQDALVLTLELSTYYRMANDAS